MGFNKKDLARVKLEYSEKYRIAQSASEDRKIELWSKIEGLRELDKALSMTGIRIMAAAMEKGADTRELIFNIKSENEALLAKRAELLRNNGYPEDYTDPKYECDKCGDTGYVNEKMCDCIGSL
jgi:DNA replication protein DnaC